VNSTAQTLAVQHQQNQSVPNANGVAVNSTVTITNSTGSTVYTGTNGSHYFDLFVGNYTIVIQPVNYPNTNMTYYNYTVDGNFSLPGFDAPALPPGALAVYSVNPLGNFQYADITVQATGDVFTKCDIYNFTNQSCEDDQWHTIAYGLTPGALYNITIYPGDPGFAEFNGTSFTNDTQLRQQNPNNNYGSLATMVVGTAGNVNRKFNTIIKFDLSNIPSGVRIDKANLTFYVTDTDASGARTHNVHKINDDRPWIELQATWNNYNTATAWTTAGGDYNATVSATASVGATGYYSFNVTDDVQIFADNQSKNLGWLIKDNAVTTNTRKTYVSSNGATANQRPLLQVNWTDIRENAKRCRIIFLN
jgi:hypothetical protein